MSAFFLVLINCHQCDTIRSLLKKKLELFIMQKIILFHKNNCVQCKMTTKLLDGGNVPYESINIDEQPDYAAVLKEEGYLSAPVIKVFVDDKLTDSWTGFQVSKVRAIMAVA